MRYLEIIENMDHSKDGRAVEELRAALEAHKAKLQDATDDQVYDIIDKIMTRIARSHSISGQELHDMWVDQYKQIPDTWIMNEAFDRPYAMKWEKSEADDSMDALVRLPDGSNLSIMFNMDYDEEGEEVVQAEFWRNNSQEVTGEGDAQRIFATVLAAIQQYIKKHKPKRLSFSASKEVDMDADHVEKFNPESRAKLYDRLVQRYARAWGYRASRADTGSIVRYELSRVAKGVAEGEIDEGVNDPHTFKCIFLFGPMGAGKSTVARPLLSHTGLRSVNLDNFNEMFIKKGQVPTGHLAPDQLEKSWQLSQTQQQNFIDGRLGVIIDGSGRNPDTAISVIQKLHPLGYEFMMIFVNVSEATSIARQQSRADKQQQQWGVGRQVDPTLAKNTYAQVQRNLAKYSAYFGPQGFVYIDNENTPDLTQATKKVDAFLRAPVTRPEALAWIQAQKGGQQVAQQQQKLATAQSRQQQALVQYKQGPLNPKFAKNGMTENTAAGINKMFNNLGDPVYANLQRVALLAMQGRQQEAHGRLNSVIKDASPQVQKKIIDAVNVIKPVTINGRVADSSTLDKSKAHQDWILNTFIPWVQSLLGQQVSENFHDGRNPQDKGDSKRYGVPTKASVSTLRKVAKQGGRKGQLAHWMANMKAGKKKHHE